MWSAVLTRYWIAIPNEPPRYGAMRATVAERGRGGAGQGGEGAERQTATRNLDGGSLSEPHPTVPRYSEPWSM